MIDEKKIEEAANKYAIDTYAFNEPVPTEYKKGIQEIFQEGINWFKENLWHDTSEEPKPSPKDKHGSVKECDIVMLLGMTKDDEVKMMYSTHEEEYEGDTEGYWLFHDEEGNTYNPFFGEVKKWLYIDDFMPKGGKS